MTLALWTLVALVSVPVPTATEAPEPCVPTTQAQAEAFLANPPNACLIFFATWCAPCRAHVLDARPQDIIVGVFDDPAAVNRAVRRLKVTNRCLLGDPIAKALGVRHVPARHCWSNTQPSEVMMR